MGIQLSQKAIITEGSFGIPLIGFTPPYVVPVLSVLLRLVHYIITSLVSSNFYYVKLFFKKKTYFRVDVKVYYHNAIASSYIAQLTACCLLFNECLLCPRDEESGGILIYPCPSVRPSGYRYMVCPAISSYSFGATALIFCMMFIHIMEVDLFIISYGQARAVFVSYRHTSFLNNHS